MLLKTTLINNNILKVTTDQRVNQYYYTIVLDSFQSGVYALQNFLSLPNTNYINQFGIIQVQ